MQDVRVDENLVYHMLSHKTSGKVQWWYIYKRRMSKMLNPASKNPLLTYTPTNTEQREHKVICCSISCNKKRGGGGNKTKVHKWGTSQKTKV